jgi:hypothetical protein
MRRRSSTSINSTTTPSARPRKTRSAATFTINALFYDIGTYSIIDYVGGLQDLKDGLIRSIGDPNERFQEDPVRMLRAIVMASRLNFRLDRPIVAAITTHRGLMASASASRLIEEYYKILRSGYAELTFRALAEHRLLDPVTPEIQRGARNDALWTSLAALDAYRRKFESAPPSLRNPVLLGSILIPLGLMPRNERRHFEPVEDEPEEIDVNTIEPLKSKPLPAAGWRRANSGGRRRNRSSRSACCRSRAAIPNGCARCCRCNRVLRTSKCHRGPSAR